MYIYKYYMYEYCTHMNIRMFRSWKILEDGLYSHHDINGSGGLKLHHILSGFP